jgi:hypothetical protein
MENYRITENVSPRQKFIYKFIDSTYNYKFIPKFYDYNEETQQMKTQKIKAKNDWTLLDIYGEKAEEVDDDVFKSVQHIVAKLYVNGIINPNITPRNFVRDNDGNLWMIDFQDTFVCNNIFSEIDQNKFTEKEFQSYLFVQHFIRDNMKVWNPLYM